MKLIQTIMLEIFVGSQNGQNRGKPMNNTSGFKGVSFHKQHKKYQAQIKIPEGKVKHLGYFITAKEASEEYQNAAKKYHGEFYNKN